MLEKLTLQEEEEERNEKEDDPRVNFRFAQIANEQDIQHMVSSNCKMSLYSCQNEAHSEGSTFGSFLLIQFGSLIQLQYFPPNISGG